MHPNIKCPYCGHEFNYENEDDVSQDETVYIQCENEDCEQIFVATAVYSLNYVAVEKADCLNGGGHILKKSGGVPDCFPPQYRCQICDAHGPIEAFEKHTFVK